MKRSLSHLSFTVLASVLVAAASPAHAGTAPPARLVYSTYLGGSGVPDPDDEILDIAVDSAGNAVVTGWTAAPQFPVLGAINPTFGGVTDGFVSKLKPDGSGFVFSTYLGGLGRENSVHGAVDLDADGNIYLTGTTQSDTGIPTTGAVQSVRFGQDCYVVKLRPDGTVVYGTYFGGTRTDTCVGIAVDPLGSAYVTGFTLSDDFPLTEGAFQSERLGISDAFVFKLGPGGELAYSTLFGGAAAESPSAIAVDASGRAAVTGSTNSADFPIRNAFQGQLRFRDAYVLVLAPNGGDLEFSTFLGGSGGDDGRAIAVSAEGEVFAGGISESTDFPTTVDVHQTVRHGASDGFVARFSPAGALRWSTFYGGNGQEQVSGIAIDSQLRPHITGFTNSMDLPLVRAVQSMNGAAIIGGNLNDAFAAQLSADAIVLQFSTYLGGSNVENARDSTGIALGPGGDVFLGGHTYSFDFPTTAGAFQPMVPDNRQGNGFVARISLVEASPSPASTATRTPTPTSSATRTVVEPVSPTSTATRAASPTPLPACVGDCDGDATVSVDEIIRAVGIALGNAPIDGCGAIDANGDGTVSVDELVRAVGNGLAGCA